MGRRKCPLCFCMLSVDIYYADGGTYSTCRVWTLCFVNLLLYRPGHIYGYQHPLSDVGQLLHRQDGHTGQLLYVMDPSRCTVTCFLVTVNTACDISRFILYAPDNYGIIF